MGSQTNMIATAACAILICGLSGCSRTVGDVARWKANGNIERLIGALEDPKANVRRNATEALGELKAGAAAEPLAALLDDPVVDIRRKTVEALVAIGGGPASKQLVAALQLESPELRTIAATGLGSLKATLSVDALIAALDDDEESVRCAAATALGLIGEGKASAPLASKLNAPSAEFRSSAINALVAIGQPSVPAMLDALKDENDAVRSAAISILQKTGAVPTAGKNLIWFQLAHVSDGSTETVDQEVVEQLAGMGGDTVEILLEAAGHSVPDFREHAFQALEIIGEPCTEKAIEATASHAGPDGLAWFNGRSIWSGAPSWRIDLWGAIAALNPDFALDGATVAKMQSQGSKAFRAITSPEFTLTRAYIPLLIDLLGDPTTPPPEQPDFDQDGIPVVKRAVDRFNGKTNQQTAKDKLIEAGDRAVLPLITALAADNALVAGRAAEILGEMNDRRAIGPLIEILEQKMAAGESVTASPFHTALQKMADPAAEATLLRILPDTGRAICVFERHYAGIRVSLAERLGSNGQVEFRLGYINDGKAGETRITFAKNEAGDWVPSPPLPDNLPK